MKKLSIQNLRAGQTFTEPVYIEGSNLLVPAGIPIRKKDIDRLKSWNVDAVYTNGEAISDLPKPGMQAAENKQSPQPRKPSPGVAQQLLTLTDVQENKGVYRSYVDLIERLDTVFSNIAAGISVETRAIDAIAGKLLQALRENRDQMIGFILGGEVSGHILAKNSVNTAILSTLIAGELRIPNHKVLHITTGALLHDVGMLKLPQDILEKQGGLSDGELQRVQAHPLYAFKIICKELLYPEDVGVVALQHHERWDGDGYPRKIAGEAIELGARIVSVSDAFEAMVSKKSYRNSMMGYQAMKNLLSDNSRRFDPDVLKAFIKTMGIYPIGSIVLLNNGSIARVLEVHRDTPLRPQIAILIDEFGKTFSQDSGEVVDLLTEKSLFIARAIDPKELSKIP